MKKRKIMALLLATVIGASVLGVSACSKKDSDDKKSRHEDEEEETEEATETEVPETTVVETTVIETDPVIETEETEPVVTPNVELGECGNEANEADAIAYELFMDFVNNESFDSDALFIFEHFRYGANDGVDSRWGLVVNTGDVSVAYAVIDGEVVETTLGHDWYPEGGSPKDVFLQLPIMVEEEVGELVPSSDIEDGTYQGTWICSNEAGTQALVEIGYPVIIDADTFNSLDSVDSFTDINGNAYNIDSMYDTEYASSAELSLSTESGEYVYGWFISLDNGNYILHSDSDYTPYAYSRYCIIDISPDCQIEDHFCWLTGGGDGDPLVGVNPDEPLTLTNSYYYDYLHTYTYGNVYNGWMSGGYSLLEPVEVQDGEIVNVVLGWR